MINYSIIIPHKNCPQLLIRLINSIPERDDVQVIVVDDNSCEGNKPCLERENVEVIYLDSNLSKGAGKARNVGLEHAKGRWLLFADADDYYNEGFLEILDGYCNSDNEVIYFNFIHIDSVTGETLSIDFKKVFDEYDGSEEAMEIIKFGHKVPWTKMVNACFVRKYGFKFEEVPNGNDIFFSMMVGYFSKKVAYEKRPLYVYLRNENSLVTKKLSREEALCRITHVQKLNCFYSYVNHCELGSSFMMAFLCYLKTCGFSFLWFFIQNMTNMIIHRNEWVKYIKNTSNDYERTGD